MPITIPKGKINLTSAPGPELVSAFDYSSVAPAVATEAKAAAVRIRSRITGIKANIIETGKDLLAIKNRLGHGHFGPWLHAEFGMSDRTASRYMLAAKMLGDISDNLADLPKHIINALAAPSTPDVAKEVVIAQVGAGNTPSVADVQTMIAEAKTIEASTPKMPPAIKAAAVTAAVATNKKTAQEKAKPEEKLVVASKLTEEMKAENAAKAELTPAAQKAHDRAVKQAVALLCQHLPDKTLATFTKHCRAASWNELASALKEAA